jgi:hypothetical protein
MTLEMTYERMLDKNMQYSCGYWKNADDLEQAQENKMKLKAEKLKLEHFTHLLINDQTSFLLGGVPQRCKGRNTTNRRSESD